MIAFSSLEQSELLPLPHRILLCFVHLVHISMFSFFLCMHVKTGEGLFKKEEVTRVHLRRGGELWECSSSEVKPLC